MLLPGSVGLDLCGHAVLHCCFWIFFLLICHFSSPGLSFPIHAVREGQEVGEWLGGLLAGIMVRLSRAASVSACRLHAPPLSLSRHSTRHRRRPMLGWGASKPAAQHPLARKQVSELSPGWEGVSHGANCRAAGEAGRRQRRGRDHLVMRQLRISWDIIAGLPSRLLEVPGLPLVNQR